MTELIAAVVVAIGAAVMAYFKGRRDSGKKQADAYQKRKDRIDEAGNDTSGLDRDQLNDRLRKATRK